MSPEQKKEVLEKTSQAGGVACECTREMFGFINSCMNEVGYRANIKSIGKQNVVFAVERIKNQ